MVLDAMVHFAINNLINKDIMLDHCSCIQMNNTDKVMIVWYATCVTPNGTTIGTKFVSKFFMTDFVHSLALSIGIKASHLNRIKLKMDCLLPSMIF